jgi:hypothetical protein
MLPTFYAPSKMPYTVFFNKDPVPIAIPLPIYKGPLSNPWAGKVTKFLNPFPILLATFTGVEIKAREPTIENS